MIIDKTPEFLEHIHRVILYKIELSGIDMNSPKQQSPDTVVLDNLHKERYTASIREASLAGNEVFQAWFAPGMDNSIAKGHWDFASLILTPKVCKALGSVEHKAALEIGYGGGRLMNAACEVFQHVIGIDIHEEGETVSAFLKRNGKHNFNLLTTAGRTIDVSSESVDFVYSLIVLQHLQSFDTFVDYLEEIYRCLKPGGLAQLYFGTFRRLSFQEKLRYFPKGFKEIKNAKVNYTSLLVSVSRVRHEAKKLGFKVIDTGYSYKPAKDGKSSVKGGQDYMTLVK
jgi:ubiquinone/menaquinone biosynthesis C-methylase UbiE